MMRAMATAAINSVWQVAAVWVAVRLLDRPIARLPGRTQFHILLAAILCAAALPWTTAVVWVEVAGIFPPIRQMWLPGSAIAALSAAWAVVVTVGATRLIQQWRSAGSRTTGPSTYGVLHPTVVIPSALFAPQAREALEAAVEHELAHVRRRDYAINLVVAAASLPFSLPPGILALKRRLAFAREAACDDTAARAMGRDRYVSGLVAAASLLPVQPAGLETRMLGSTSLERRIDRLLTPPPAPGPLTTIAIVFPIVAISLVASSVHLCVAAAAAKQGELLGPADVRRAAAVLSAATLPFDHASRTEWRRTPGQRPGKRIADLTAPESAALNDLLRTGLSARGYQRAIAVMKQDDALKRLRPHEPLGNGEYVVAIYGTPDGSGPWAWRLEGHHLSIRTTYGPGRTSVTPFSIGFEPSDAVVLGVRPLEQREATILAMIGSLSGEVRSEATRDVQGPLEVLIGERSPQFAPVAGGTLLSRLTQEQRTLAWAVIEDYIGDAPVHIRDAVLARCKHADGEMRLGFNGTAQPNERLYFRLAGPTDVFEYQNVGRHIHSVWRSNDDY